MVKAINEEVNPKHSIMVELKSLDSSWGGQCWGLFFLAVKQPRSFYLKNRNSQKAVFV